MADWEAVVKWAIIGGTLAFTMWMVYEFATKQGWLTYRQRLTRMRTR